MSQTIPQQIPRTPVSIISGEIYEEDPHGQSLVFLRQNAQSMMKNRPQPKVFDIDPPINTNTSRFSSSSTSSTSSSENSGPLTPTANINTIDLLNEGHSIMLETNLKPSLSISKGSNNSPSLKAAKILGISQITKVRNITQQVRQLPSHPDIHPNFTTAGVDQVVRITNPPSKPKPESVTIPNHKEKFVGYIKKKADKATNSFQAGPVSPQYPSSTGSRSADPNDTAIVTLDKLRRFHGDILLEGSVYVYRVNPTNLVNLQTWKKRHLVLGGTQLFKFDLPSNQASTWGSIPALEWVDLMDDVHIMVSSQFPGHNHVLKVTFPDNILWFVSFESHPTLIKWLKAFKKAKTSSLQSSNASTPREAHFSQGVKLSMSRSIESTSSEDTNAVERVNTRPKFKQSSPPVLPTPVLPSPTVSLPNSPFDEVSSLRFSRDQDLDNGDASFIIPPPTFLPPEASIDDDGNLQITYRYPNVRKSSEDSMASNSKRGTVIQMLNRVDLSPSAKQVGGASIKMVNSYQSDESQTILHD
jgi:hypothetical protein